VTVLDVLVALAIVPAVIGGEAYLNHLAHLASLPGDHTPPDTREHATGRVVVVEGAGTGVLAGAHSPRGDDAGTRGGDDAA
jgi:hypothetical protein